jgi:hypothetical protein
MSMHRLVTALVVSVALLPLRAVAIERPGPVPISSLGPAPTGLAVVLTTKELGDKKWLTAVNNPSISGVALQIHWSDIEPTSDSPDWSKLDTLFSTAAAAKKWVQLLVFPGFFTPSWALAGVQTDTFPIQYGPGAGTPTTLPMPWDPTYLSNWFAFVNELANRYGTSPAFRMIGAAGPTSVSVEATLPGTPADLKQWQKDGYTPSKYTDAWKQTMAAYNSDFPNQYVSLSTGSGLRINDKGMIGKAEVHSIMLTIVNEATKTLGRRFALQYSNLDGTTDPPQKDFTLVISDNGSIVTGLQMRTSAANAGMGADGNPPLALRLAITKGMQLNSASQHVNYIEIQEPDVLASDMQPVLTWGASLFTPHKPIIPHQNY